MRKPRQKTPPSALWWILSVLCFALSMLNSGFLIVFFIVFFFACIMQWRAFIRKRQRDYEHGEIPKIRPVIVTSLKSPGALGITPFQTKPNIFDTAMETAWPTPDDTAATNRFAPGAKLSADEKRRRIQEYKDLLQSGIISKSEYASFVRELT